MGVSDGTRSGVTAEQDQSVRLTCLHAAMQLAPHMIGEEDAKPEKIVANAQLFYNFARGSD